MWKCIVIQYQSRCVVPSTVVGTVMTLCGVHLLMQATVTCRDTQTVQTHNKHQQVRVDVATQMVRKRSISDVWLKVNNVFSLESYESLFLGRFHVSNVNLIMFFVYLDSVGVIILLNKDVSQVIEGVRKRKERGREVEGGGGKGEGEVMERVIGWK